MSTKTLFILRHAKAVPAEGAMDDHERPLAGVGEREALKTGLYMKHRGIAPQLTLCSTSLRTRQTLHQLEAALETPLAVEFDAKLYLATPRDVLERMAQVEPRVRSLMIVGHNPTLHQLCLDLIEPAGGGAPGELTRHLPTGALVEIHYPAEEWGELGRKAGVLKRFVVPGAVEAV